MTPHVLIEWAYLYILEVTIISWKPSHWYIMQREIVKHKIIIGDPSEGVIHAWSIYSTVFEKWCKRRVPFSFLGPWNHPNLICHIFSFHLLSFPLCSVGQSKQRKFLWEVLQNTKIMTLYDLWTRIKTHCQPGAFWIRIPVVTIVWWMYRSFHITIFHGVLVTFMTYKALILLVDNVFKCA